MSEQRFKEAKSQLSFSQALRDRLMASQRPPEMPPEAPTMQDNPEMVQDTAIPEMTPQNAPQEQMEMEQNETPMEESQESTEHEQKETDKPSRVEEMLAKAIETITGLFKSSEKKADATSKELKDVKSQMEKIINE